MVKETGEILTVLSVEVYSKKVLVCCDDGNIYHHRDIRSQKTGTRNRRQELLTGYFFMPRKQMMHFDPGDSTPEMHTDTVDQNITRNERRKKYVNQRICPEPDV